MVSEKKQNKGRGRHGAGRRERRRKKASNCAEAVRQGEDCAGNVGGGEGPVPQAPKAAMAPEVLREDGGEPEPREAAVTSRNPPEQVCSMVECGQWVT